MLFKKLKEYFFPKPELVKISERKIFTMNGATIYWAVEGKSVMGHFCKPSVGDRIVSQKSGVQFVVKRVFNYNDPPDMWIAQVELLKARHVDTA